MDRARQVGHHGSDVFHGARPARTRPARQVYFPRAPFLHPDDEHLAQEEHHRARRGRTRRGVK